LLVGIMMPSPFCPWTQIAVLNHSHTTVLIQFQDLLHLLLHRLDSVLKSSWDCVLDLFEVSRLVRRFGFDQHLHFCTREVLRGKVLGHSGKYVPSEIMYIYLFSSI
jgi:hypothetical protein